MIPKKKLIWIASVLTLLLVLTGCTPNQQVIFDAAMKMQKVHSMQQHTTMTFQLSGSGFEPTIQQQVNLAAGMLNNAKLDLTAKTSGNDLKTVSKSQIDMNLTTQGLTLNVPVWVDMDLSGSTPRLLEIFKVPPMAIASLPPQFTGKEYAVMNPYATSNSELNRINPAKLIEFSQNFQTKYVNFLTSYAKRFNPNLEVVNVPTNDGSSKYTLKLNDAQFKELISYTVNHFAQDQEAMNFMKEFMTSIVEINQIAVQTGSSNNLEQAFNDRDMNIPQFLAQFNSIMNQLMNVTFLSDKGLELNYTISGGYIIQEGGILNFKVDLSQIAPLLNSSIGAQSAGINAKGTLDLAINFNTDITNINAPVDIQIPKVTSNNSFNYFDLIKVLTAPPRLAGLDRYQTARAIGEEYNRGQVDNIILASGTNFPDALSATLLSKKLTAPILLVGPTVEESADALSYITAHSNANTKIYIIGGTGVISESLEAELLKGGHATERLSGLDLYDTNIAVVTKVNVNPGTPVILATGESFPDALSISSFAGSNQYPILLVSKSDLAEKTKNYISTQNPSTVYIAGGVSAVSQSIEDQVKALIPSISIKRLAGTDRFETASAVVNEFATTPNTIYLANGFNFSDALAGSAIASKTGDPILLIDQNSETLPPAIESYLKTLQKAGIHPMIRALGGGAVVPERLVQQAGKTINGI
ncbi:MAG: cell wall-binding protein [Firmicutes bacterium]|nr:cell wall-binding protein [Bacillota bacterium]